MANMPFYKYQGAGNDFVMVDQRQQAYLKREDTERIAWLCHRRFGIGADGLILLEPAEGYDFEMIYFNADGREGTMCGNGGRCVAAFAHFLGIATGSCRFLAVDGPHDAVIIRPDWIELKMRDVALAEIEQGQGYYFMDTGSPHYVEYVEDIAHLDVVERGRAIRYSEPFCEEGANINFVKSGEESLAVATYERGVEDETLACGTGVTASAITYALRSGSGPRHWAIPIKVKGGELEVRFQFDGEAFREVWLCGPAEQVFSGSIHLPRII